jgi:ubiquinone/menaquinone biosynthesis C-methylase UbiE
VASPTLHDHLTHLGLRLAKRGRERYSHNHSDFYSQFFLEKHLDESKYDLRARLRRKTIRRALAETGMPERPVIADIGAGVGDVIDSTPPAATRIGVSYSRTDLDLARRACSVGILFVSASAFELPFASDSINVILCLEVIEQLPNDGSVVKELARVLKQSGILLLSVPGHHYFADYFDLIGHYRHYSRESLLRLLAVQKLQLSGTYIDGHPFLNKLHYYPYMMLQGIHSSLERCGWPARSMYVRPWIESIYQRIAAFLARLARERSQAELEADDTSTFVLAVKLS